MGSLGTDGIINNDSLKGNLKQVEGIENAPDKIEDNDFPLIVKVDGYDVTIEKNGKVKTKEDDNTPKKLPVTDETKPFLPDEATVVEDDLSEGVVIKDKNQNEWVWIEVPKSIYKNASYNEGVAPVNSEDYDKIESVIQTYANDYRNSDFVDKWQAGCGMLEGDYTTLKQGMLKSVYENGGFYIGKYEAGTSVEREEETKTLSTPLLQRDVYPYIWVSCEQAQNLCKQMKPDAIRTTSLMFGIQWDLTVKYIEEKGIQLGETKEERKTKIINDSSDWGNYEISDYYSLNRGKYKKYEWDLSLYDWISEGWREVSVEEEKVGRMILTTGATERNSILNIYDLAGNVEELTLEYQESNQKFTVRGGDFFDGNGDSFTSSKRDTFYGVSYKQGFRPTLW